MQARPDVRSTWEEHGALPGPVVLRVDGVNQDEQDKLELENFARGLSAPSKEDPGGKAYARGTRMGSRAMSPMDAVRLACAFVFAGVTAGTLSGTEVSGGVALGLGVGAFIFGLAFPTIVQLILAKRAAPVTRITRGVFELRFDAGHFACTGAGTAEVRYDLARVRSFTGGRRLSVELTDAPTATLPLSVASRNNGPLASRLNDLLAASRASSSRAW